MGAPEKERRPVLGLGLPADASDASAWRPSHAADSHSDASAVSRRAESETQSAESRAEAEKNRTGEAAAGQKQNAAWRPSEASRARLGSLEPVRGRKRFAMPRGLRVAVSFALLVCGLYIALRIWVNPTAGDFHAAVLIFVGAMILLFLAAIAGAVMRRKRKRSDEKSTLKL